MATTVQLLHDTMIETPTAAKLPHGMQSHHRCVAILYTAAFVAVRALDGAYTAPSELLASLAPERAPSFALSSLTRLDSNALARSPAKFARAVAIAFGVLTVLYTAMMGFGYATFGDHAASRAFRSLAADASRVPLIVALLAVITAVACAVEDSGGCGGGCVLPAVGAAIVYCFPPLIYGRARGASTPQAVYGLIPLGGFLGVLGTYVTLRG
ncbi:hypothetical protein EMIHUDRAFT_224190 [Emiliania huxleyi CCMP1516]|uniref:Amino acid transporter transmembrane domain-containing protein n=2 Tax=Emiliania huxleyi TaxID=2903 RepID=A0A0D3KSP3_EMIH1|nr:hypothetical protein EMIHUDRAFT_224190 [Emiliania huxleyi CCMP1516]EOD38778.1 hypothetical protein EMIHUDRAFT_224190 [Emiliania huxleyi CCMP1516]|eukprot:XP_005791207.1 hypothetical protein EMIHUDRAFT_224190 [Emiliania huxleyi CCMP1516]